MEKEAAIKAVAILMPPDVILEIDPKVASTVVNKVTLPETAPNVQISLFSQKTQRIQQ